MLYGVDSINSLKGVVYFWHSLIEEELVPLWCCERERERDSMNTLYSYHQSIGRMYSYHQSIGRMHVSINSHSYSAVSSRKGPLGKSPTLPYNKCALTVAANCSDVITAGAEVVAGDVTVAA